MKHNQCEKCNLYNSLGCPYAGCDWEEGEVCDKFRPLHCPYDLTEYETESEDFWKYCYDCPHCVETDSGLDTLTCEIVGE